MSEDITDKKETEEVTEESRAYALQSSLPFHLSIQETTHNGKPTFKWDCKYETSLPGQVAVFGYMIDMLYNVIENMEKRHLEDMHRISKMSVKDKKAVPKTQFSYTKINKVIDFRNWCLETMDDMLPVIWKHAKENDNLNIKIVSPAEATSEIEKEKVRQAVSRKIEIHRR